MRLRPLPPNGANHVGCYHFTHDACANGQALKCLTIVDEHTRECLAVTWLPASGPPGHRGAREAHHRAPTAQVLRSDNGPVLIAKAVQDWLKAEGIETAYIAPSKPWQNGVNESSNGMFRDECLDVKWSPNRREAVVVIEMFRPHYNGARPHSSLGYRTPHEFRDLLQFTAQTPALTF